MSSSKHGQHGQHGAMHLQVLWITKDANQCIDDDIWNHHITRTTTLPCIGTHPMHNSFLFETRLGNHCWMKGCIQSFRRYLSVLAKLDGVDREL